MTLEEAEASQRIPVADCQMRSFSAQHAGSRPLGQKSSKRILALRVIRDPLVLWQAFSV